MNHVIIWFPIYLNEINFNHKCNNYKNSCERECISLVVATSDVWFENCRSHFIRFTIILSGCHLAPCKVIWDSVGFGILRCGFRITEFLSAEILFRTPWAKFRIPNPRILNFLDSGIWITLHGASELLWSSTLCTVNTNSVGLRVSHESTLDRAKVS